MKFKDVLKKLREDYIQAVLKKPFYHTPTAEYVRGIDRTLREIFPREAGEVTLIAKGSYARRELSPFSDIDCLLLYTLSPGRAGDVFYALWDAGFETGHLALSLDEVLDALKKDLTLFTSLLMTRYVCGSRRLYSAFREIIEEFLQSMNYKRFAADIREVRRDRYEKYGESPLLLHPNVKFGAGGLRDYHEILWLTAPFVQPFSPASILETPEARRMKNSYRFILSFRNQMHALSGKKTDEITDELLTNLCRKLSGSASPSVVRKLMKNYYGHAESVFLLSSRAMHALMGLRRPSIKDFKSVYALQKKGEHVPPGSSMADGDLSSFILPEKRLKKWLEKSFSLEGRVSSALRVLKEMGLFYTLFKELKHVRYMYQFDAYHSYTVDEHTVKGINCLDSFFSAEKRNITPGLLDAVHGLNSRAYLTIYLAFLFHDAGKGASKGHERRSELIARRTMARMGFSDELVDEVAFLVNSHTLMSKFAERRDPTDPGTLKTFADIVGNEARLRMLLILTFADICALGKGALTPWRVQLLDTLYFRCLELFEMGEVSTQFLKARAERVKRAFLHRKKGKRLASTFAGGLDPVYFSTHTFEEVLEHYSLFENYFEKKEASISYSIKEDHVKISIVAEDRPGLLSIICGCFTLAGFNILSAKIESHAEKVAIDDFHVTPTSTDVHTVRASLRLFEKYLRKAMEKEIHLDEKLKKRKIYLPHVRIKVPSPAVFYDNTVSDEYTVLEVFSPDLPGLLYYITSVISKEGYNLHSAFIHTLQGTVRDGFYVHRRGGGKLTDKEALTLKEKIEFRIKSEIERYFTSGQ